MKLKQIAELLEAGVVVGQDRLDEEIDMACGSDLMSDVLTYIKAGALLLTGLTNTQVIRTAEMADVVAVCFVRGKQPQDETVQLAREKAISLITTIHPMYESCGRLYARGLPGCTDRA